MDVHASEKEQIEALKKWWKENGSSVITGILLGLSVLLGGKAWFSYQETRSLSASNIYAQMIAALGRQDTQTVRTHANQLIGDYGSSGYATLAALALARVAISDGEPSAAQAQLQWALDHADTRELEHVARLRLVRLLIDQQQFQEARERLQAVEDAGAYAYLYTELRGDLAVAEGNPADAARSYQQARDDMPAQAPNAALLDAKYEDVAGAGSASQ
jgi:predicted negative regulator of RcsB-dependent stress response